VETRLPLWGGDGGEKGVQLKWNWANGLGRLFCTLEKQEKPQKKEVWVLTVGEAKCPLPQGIFEKRTAEPQMVWMVHINEIAPYGLMRRLSRGTGGTLFAYVGGANRWPPS